MRRGRRSPIPLRNAKTLWRREKAPSAWDRSLSTLVPGRAERDQGPSARVAKRNMGSSGHAVWPRVPGLASHIVAGILVHGDRVHLVVARTGGERTGEIDHPAGGRSVPLASLSANDPKQDRLDVIEVYVYGGDVAEEAQACDVRRDVDVSATLVP